MTEMVKALSSCTALCRAVEARKLPVVKTALSRGASPNCVSADGTPVLILAAMSNVAIVKVLLEAGAKVSARTTMRSTALHFVSDARIAELLISAGADVNAADRHKLNPLHFAAVWGRIQVARTLLSSGANVNCSDEDGRTPLQIAAENGFAEVVDVLLEEGANPDIATNKFHFTPLRSAIAENRPEQRVKIVERLIAAGAKLDLRDFEDNTAVMCAARSGNPKIVRALVDAGADIKAVDSDGFSPLHFAVLSENPECVAILLKSGANVDQRISPKFGDKTRAGKNAGEVAAALKLNRIAVMIERNKAQQNRKS